MTYTQDDWDLPVWGTTPESYIDCLLARADADADFASAAERTVAPGRCTLCEEDSPELVPWSGERLCWNCADRQLDMLALAVGPEFEELLAA